MTSYGVRRAFLDSPSAFWSGSAGAIYPALKRMEAAGFVESRDATRGKRAAREVSLTRKGREAVADWSADLGLAVGAGYDPFRIRAPLWAVLPPGERAALIEEARATVKRRIAEIDALDPDHPDAVRHALERALQISRLEWLKSL